MKYAILTAIVIAFASGQCDASTATITAVDNTPLTDLAVRTSLSVGDHVYTDRPYTYDTLPSYLVGLDFIQLANEDKLVPGYELEVELNPPATVYLFIDDRVSDGRLPAQMSWVTERGFTDTGDNLITDETAFGLGMETFSVYSINTAANGLLLLEQNHGVNTSMYGIAVATIPEPCTLIITSLLGAMGIAFCRWRCG